MKQLLSALSILALLSACGDGNPFPEDEEIIDEEPTEEPDPSEPVVEPDASDALSTGTVRPPQTEDLIARGDIIRAEAENDIGGGLLAEVRYNSDDDTFYVDGLGFDGENIYQRGAQVAQMNGYAVYDADVTTPDSLTGDPIGQIVPYRAIYGVSQNSIASGEPRTSFAIVRTGGYVDYGFGGFLYERNGQVVLPTSGQAIYTGDYAGVRVFQDRGGLEYVEGDMSMAIDFNDFNTNDAVNGVITNRVAFDVNGNEIPLGGDDQLIMPDINWVISAGGTDIQENGEFSGGVFSVTVNEEGLLEEYETGNYYAVLAGDNTSGDGGEVVGIIVLESEDPRDGAMAQETGGFILYRGTGD